MGCQLVFIGDWKAVQVSNARVVFGELPWVLLREDIPDPFVPAMFRTRRSA
jgi:hypothetical protein